MQKPVWIPQSIRASYVKHIAGYCIRTSTTPSLPKMFKGVCFEQIHCSKNDRKNNLCGILDVIFDVHFHFWDKILFYVLIITVANFN